MGIFRGSFSQQAQKIEHQMFFHNTENWRGLADIRIKTAAFHGEWN